jgi:glycoprotein-N-acetylgalactosamine 3-beta-galactosyltransferase
MMRMLDFFLYQIRPFGIDDRRPATPEPPPDLNLTASPWYAPKESTAATTTNNTLVNTTITPSPNSTYVNNTATTMSRLPNATANSVFPAVT